MNDEVLEGRPYPNEHACRLEDPKQFDEFRRVECDQKSDGKCIDIIYGITGTGKNRKSKIQALRYKKSIWSASDARSHCKSRGGSFEAASNKEIKTEDSLFFRTFELERTKVDIENRTLELSFSSEYPVRRWFGNEILLHGNDNVDLSRLKKIGAALLNHDPSKIVGPIKKVWIDEKKGKALIGFDDDEIGENALKKVSSGSLRGASVAYAIQKFREIMEKEEWEGIKGPAMVALRWMPYEITLTPVPADPTVGPGRGRELTRSLEGIEIEKSEIEEEKDMTNEEVKTIFREMLPELVPELTKQLKDIISEESKPKFRVTAEECRDLLGQAGAISPEAKAATADMMAEGKNAVEIQRELVQMATVKPDGDQTDKGTSEDPTQTRGAGMTADKIDDETFTRAICDPSEMPMD